MVGVGDWAGERMGVLVGTGMDVVVGEGESWGEGVFLGTDKLPVMGI